MDAPILVIEDEDDIRNLVALNLRRAGFNVHTARDATEGLELLRRHHPPVLLLDLMLPDMSGTEVCVRLRADPELRETYVIMVTARTQEEDRIEGFQVGADDYVTKPFSVRELVLRVQAAAQRMEARQQWGKPKSQDVDLGLVKIDVEAHRAYVSGEELDLTATEYRLLVYLATNPGKMCSRGELLQEVWELPPNLNTRTVDTHVKRLRHKLLGAADMVETVRGAGYRFHTGSD